MTGKLKADFGRIGQAIEHDFGGIEHLFSGIIYRIRHKTYFAFKFVVNKVFWVRENFVKGLHKFFGGINGITVYLVEGNNKVKSLES